MKKFTPKDLAALVVWLIPIAYMFYVYNTLPDTVPMHYNAHGQIDRYGNKSEFRFASLMMSGVALLVYFLVRFLPSIDPKKKAQYDQGTYQKVAVGLMLFLSVLNICIIYATVNHGFKIQNVIFPVVGFFFAFMGNMMHSIKPNYFVGIRTPWTLEDEDTWRATHQLASKIWFIGGIAIAIGTLLLPDKYDVVFFMPSLLIMAFVPVIYSYVYFKKRRKVN